MNHENSKSDQYVTIGNINYRIVSFPDSFFEITRRMTAELFEDIDREQARREAEKILLEKSEAIRVKEEDEYIQNSLQLMLIRLYMSLA